MKVYKYMETATLKEDFMIKKLLIKTLTSVAVFCGLCFCAMTAHGATIQEVVDTAEKYGIPQELIQQGLNEYYSDPDVYDEEYLDEAVEYIEIYHEEILKQLLGDITTASTAVSGQQTTTTTTTVTTPTGGSNGGSSGGSTGGSTGGNGSSTQDPNGFISEQEFIKMTLEEKRAYIASLPADKQQIFLSSLTAEQLQSIVKQLPADGKADVLDKFVQAGEQLGVQVTIDEIKDDNISMTLRDDEGGLVDVATVGVIVEDTGFDYRPIFSVSAVMLLTAGALLWVVFRKMKSGAENE